LIRIVSDNGIVWIVLDWFVLYGFLDDDNEDEDEDEDEDVFTSSTPTTMTIDVFEVQNRFK
jgi:hypothetical protein